MKRILLALCIGIPPIVWGAAFEINRHVPGYESPVDALASIRDSTASAADTAAYNALMPYTVDFFMQVEADEANLDLWLLDNHQAGDSTWAKTAQDTLRVGRVYR